MPAATKAPTLRLGDKKFILERPTLGDLRHIVDALDALTSGAPDRTGGAMIEASAIFVCAGLQPGHPGLTVDELLAIKCSVAELNAAVQLVIDNCGMRPVPIEDAVPGEAVPQLLAAK